jgi:radical SAM superfamily enzyme YgiQ (UPF0313 family)
MQYEGIIFRPPSEAESLLVQVTVGCSWNRCTFCDMYTDKKFRVRSLDEIKADLQEGARWRDRIRRIFLCDGDALVVKTADLVEILKTIRQLYPNLEGVRVYASARDILHKPVEDLKLLHQLGLDMAYLGLESGSDRILAQIDKGITKAEMIEAAAALRESGIRQSVSIIAGLGGEELWREHMLETADALNRMQPEFVGMLVLHAGNDSLMYQRILEGNFRLPSEPQVLKEMKLLLENLKLKNCYFTSAHASNYVHVRGLLPRDREKLLRDVDRLIELNGKE